MCPLILNNDHSITQLSSREAEVSRRRNEKVRGKTLSKRETEEFLHNDVILTNNM